MAVFMALLSGVSNVFNRMLNAEAARRLGVAQSTFFNYVTGLSTSLLVLLAVGEPFTPPPVNQGAFMYLGGLVGVATVSICSFAAPHLSAFSMTLILFVGQFLTSFVVDYLSGIALSPARLCGAAIVLLGLCAYLCCERGEQARQPQKDR